MNRFMVVTLTVLAVSGAGAQDRDSFLKQQAFAEMQRVTGQLDVLQSNFNDLHQRVNRMEAGNDSRALQAEVNSLKTAVSELRTDMRNLRSEIVRELSQKLVKLQAAQEPRPAPVETKVVVSGPHFEYVVEKGDTLTVIAQAYKTTVQKIKEMNGLKGDGLRVGQKLNIPKE